MSLLFPRHDYILIFYILIFNKTSSLHSSAQLYHYASSITQSCIALEQGLQRKATSRSIPFLDWVVVAWEDCLWLLQKKATGRNQSMWWIKRLAKYSRKRLSRTLILVSTSTTLLRLYLCIRDNGKIVINKQCAW